MIVPTRWFFECFAVPASKLLLQFTEDKSAQILLRVTMVKISFTCDVC